MIAVLAHCWTKISGPLPSTMATRELLERLRGSQDPPWLAIGFREAR